MRKTKAQQLLPKMHRVRGKIGKLGFHPYRVELVHTRSNSKAWDGAGAGRFEEVKAITVGGGQAPKVRFLTQKDYLAGYPSDCELEITITPELSATIADLNSESEETFFRVFGPGFGKQGARFRKAHLNTQSALTWKIGLKRISTPDHNGPGGEVT